ncbi:MAG: porin family protein [Bacteroidota bacterium]|jgi:Outer membrane protein beta-barrel domain
MKKILLTSFAFFAILIAVNAQGGFRLGIKGGLNLNQIQGVSFNNGFNYGYHLGGFAEIDFTKKFGIQPEVLWNQSNTQVSAEFATLYPTLTNPNTLNQEVVLNYLSIPLLLRYNLGSMFSIVAGPQFGILMNKNQNLLQNGQKAFSDGDFSAVAGIQVNLKTLRLYGRYNIGMKNINQIDQKDKWTSQQIQLGVGLRL